MLACWSCRKFPRWSAKTLCQITLYCVGIINWMKIYRTSNVYRKCFPNIRSEGLFKYTSSSVIAYLWGFKFLNTTKRSAAQLCSEPVQLWNLFRCTFLSFLQFGVVPWNADVLTKVLQILCETTMSSNSVLKGAWERYRITQGLTKGRHHRRTEDKDLTSERDVERPEPWWARIGGGPKQGRSQWCVRTQPNYFGEKCSQLERPNTNATKINWTIASDTFCVHVRARCNVLLYIFTMTTP